MLPCGHDEKHITSRPYIGDNWSNYCGKCAAMTQSNFMTAVDTANPPPGSFWVRVLPDTGHRVFRGGERFLVVETVDDEWYLCWYEGRKPQEGIDGTLIHKRYVERG